MTQSDAWPPPAERLRRKVRMELYLAPVLILVPASVGWLVLELGIRSSRPNYVGLGLLVASINFIFGILMVRSARVFLKRSAPDAKTEE